MRLVLHAGTPKTGTTSIQKALADNREYLRKRGLIYPDGNGIYRKAPLFSHQSFSRAFTGMSDERLELAQRFLKFISNVIENSQVALLSAENMYSYISGYDDYYYFKADDYWARRYGYLTALAEALRDFDVTVMLFFREPQSFARSLYGEVVRKGHWSSSARDFINQFRHWFEYEQQVEAFKAVFSDVRVFSYEKASEDGLVKTFFRTIGFPMPPDADQIWERKSEAKVHRYISQSKDHRYAFRSWTVGWHARRFALGAIGLN
jgi:hypothetical protein